MDQPDYLLRTRPGSDTLAIYLSARGVGGGKFNWLRLGEGQPTHALFLSDARNHWYLDGVGGLGSDLSATVAWIRATADALGVKDIRLIGSSMGAFGALLLGQHLDAPALAFSPEVVLDRPGSRSARFRRGGVPLVPTPASGSVIFGESDPHDLWTASQLSGSGLQMAGLCGVGHYASTALNRAGILQSLLASFLRDGRTPGLGALEVEKRDSGSWTALPDVGAAVDTPAYLEAALGAHEASLAKDWEQTRTLSAAACGAYPQGELAWFLLGWSTLMLQAPGEALPALAASLLLGEHKPEQRYLLGTALRKVGLSAAARTHQLQVARRWPDFGRAYFDLALLAEGRGDLPEALSLLERAIGCEPRRPLFQTRLKTIQARLKRDPETDQPPEASASINGVSGPDA